MRVLRYIVLGVLFSLQAWGFEVPAFTPNIVDTSATLSQQQISQLNQKIGALQKQSKIWAAILIVPSLNGENVESVATQTFDKWKLGQTTADNGLLFLVAVDDRKMRIEVGYGLEGSIPDLKAQQIIDDILKPNFKKRNYFEGLMTALDASNELVLKGDSIILENSNKFFSEEVIRLIWIWLFIIYGVPLIIRYLAVSKARNYDMKLQPTPEEESFFHLIFLSGSSIFVSLFLTINPGIFFVMLYKEGELGFLPFIFIFPIVFLGAVNSGYIQMLKPTWREKFLSNWFKNQSTETPVIRPQAFTGSLKRRGYRNSSGEWVSTGGAPSGGSSSSSSSGGGSSGGGGASGSW